MIEIRTISKNNRGVFSWKEIKKDQLIEIAPVIILSEDEMMPLYSTLLGSYVFKWWGAKSALALGYGSLFNHSEESNVDFELNYKEKTIEFYTTEKIKKGSQLFIDYNYDMTEGHKYQAVMKNVYSKYSKKYYKEAVDEWNKVIDN
ncbi:SET domain-containing protein-lysine N-methyltransferase [bacterium]|nr:SET domain-containing protein-lysine N-methyltransferase [bacterium]